MKCIALLCTFLSGLTAFAQTDYYIWSTGTYKYKGYFNPHQIEKVKLHNTYELWYLNYGGFKTEVLADKPNDIKKLSIIKLEKEYQNKTKKLKNFKLLSNCYWDSLRQEYLDELNAVYKLKFITIQAYSSPGVLFQYPDTDATLQKYVKALNGTNQEVLAGWQLLLDRQCMKNSNPEILRKEYSELRKSSDSLTYARIELMKYGWWNAANAHIGYVNQNIIKSEELYKTYFTKIDVLEHDEP